MFNILMDKRAWIGVQPENVHALHSVKCLTCRLAFELAWYYGRTSDGLICPFDLDHFHENG
jgi:hypothetical protein